MTKLEEYRSEVPAIIGSSTINHAARVKLGLNCSEYCFVDLIARMQDSGKHIYFDDIHAHLGFNRDESNILMKSLMAKSFIVILSGIDGRDAEFKLTSKWAEGFANIDKEFDELFWKKDGKVCWTGTRKKALEYWVRIRKRHTLDFLISQRNKYFEFLELQKKYRGFDQQKVMCQVFLNPANERYLEDYTDYVKQLKATYAPSKVEVKPVTKEDILKAYGKDNNQ